MKLALILLVIALGMWLFVGLPSHDVQASPEQSKKMRDLDMTTRALNAGLAGHYTEGCDLYKQLLSNGADLDENTKDLLELNCARANR